MLHDLTMHIKNPFQDRLSSVSIELMKKGFLLPSCCDNIFPESSYGERSQRGSF